MLDILMFFKTQLIHVTKICFLDILNLSTQPGCNIRVLMHLLICRIQKKSLFRWTSSKSMLVLIIINHCFPSYHFYKLRETLECVFIFSGLLLTLLLFCLFLWVRPVSSLYFHMNDRPQIKKNTPLAIGIIIFGLI